MINVLQVVTYMGRGGLESMIMNYYRHIDREKIQFDFLVHRDFRADYDDEIESLGGKIYRLPPLNPLSASYKKALNDFFKTHKYNIVHSHLDCMSAIPLAAAKKHGACVRIAHAHSKSQDKDWKYPIKLYEKSRIHKYATDLFACGIEAGKWMFSGSPFSVMNNAIDAQKYIYSKEVRESKRTELGLDDCFTVGHVGRFNYPKNHGFLIDVFAELLKIESNAKLLLVGDGDGRGEIENKVKSLGIEQSVIFTGVRTDVNELMQAMDVFAFPSIYEGLPVTMIEAQATGLACVMSENVPTECIVTDGLVSVENIDNAKKWAEVLLQKGKNTDRSNRFDEIADAGYEIKSASRILEEFYESK